ncbi:hypothetical protein O8B93_26250 [Agrobacterium rhizogenes]|uniref:hypothetical protein n=1 Tax=Rhizobium rhizogenes TaxID=359 RepID=UPI0022B60BA4|nr:hypothetical protein [Rhizobium rhizogenes]MCZ7451075.1 hypothetical protein [Rhizobium rhizogenes]
MKSYYQVFAWLEGDTSTPSVAMLDRDLGFVQKTFVRAYKKGDKLYWDGHVRDLSKVTKVAVYLTPAPIDDLVSQDDARSIRQMDEFNASSRSVTWIGFPNTTPLDSALEHGEDVTGKFITEPPGKSLGLSGIFNNSWVVTTVTGLLFLLITAYFGLG